MEKLCSAKVIFFHWFDIEIIIEGFLFQHKVTIYPSKHATCHAHIRYDPLVSHIETTFQCM